MGFVVLNDRKTKVLFARPEIIKTLPRVKSSERWFAFVELSSCLAASHSPTLVMAKRPLKFVSPTKTDATAEDTALSSLYSPAKAKKQCVYPEFKDISSLQQPVPHANVHGIHASLSPLKPSKYFEGELTDGTGCMRVVGFDKLQQSKLQSFFDKQQPVKLCNCEVKPSNVNKLEVIVKNYTHVELSPTKYDIKDLQTVGSKEIVLSDLDSCSEYDKVTVRVKVTDIETPVMVSGGKRKQDLTIADATASTRLTLWESDIGLLEQDESYQLTKVMVRTFQGQPYLSYPFSGATAVKIKELDDVCEEVADDPNETLHGAEIIGVPYLEAYPVCLKSSCKGKVQQSDDDLGTCMKCHMMQRISSCTTQLSANLYIQSGLTYHNLQAFGEILHEITNNDNITKASLLKAPFFSLTYNPNFVIVSISRQ